MWFLLKKLCYFADDPKKVEHLHALDGAKERLHLLKAHLLDQGAFDAAVEGCECVFHTASPFYHDVQDPEVHICSILAFLLASPTSILFPVRTF